MREFRSVGFPFQSIPKTITKLSVALLISHQIKQIANLLLSSPSLEEFTLELADGGTIERPDTDDQSSVIIHLKTFHLVSIHPIGWAGLNPVIYFLKMIRLPDLKTLTVSLEPYMTRRGRVYFSLSTSLYADEIIRVLFPARNLENQVLHSFPSLENFSVFTRDIGHDAPPVNFAYMFETMPSSLRSIIIQAHNLRLTPLLDKDPKAAVLPALTFLRLEKCDAVTVEWVKQFVQALKDEGPVGRIQEARGVPVSFLEQGVAGLHCE